MTWKIRLQKLEEHAARPCPKCLRSYDEPGNRSDAPNRAHLMQQLQEKGYSEEEAQ